MFKISNSEFSNKYSDDFLAMVTHDLKTPLYAQIRALEILLNHSKFTSSQTEILNDILNSANYMKNLIDNILHKYKYENGKLTLYKTLNSLESLTAQCIEELRPLLCDKNIKINMKSSLNEFMCFFDDIEIKRVIQNLFINAINYGAKNSAIQINLTKLPHKLVFSITNYGIGIDPKDAGRIFEKYESGLQQSKSAGSGLGLYIAKIIIEAHGGNISAKSEANNLTTMTFSLPF